MLLAKDTKTGIGCDNMSAIFITLKWFHKINTITFSKYIIQKIIKIFTIHNILFNVV
jgi:hypothetical protein